MSELITLELEKISVEKAMAIMRYFYKSGYLCSNHFFFLFEPQLIIRIDTLVDKLVKIEKYLVRNGLAYITYEYPLVSSDKNNRISRTFTEDFSDKELVQILNLSCKSLLNRTSMEYSRLVERVWHCMNNMAGRNWSDEGWIGLEMATRRLIMDKVKLKKILLHQIARFI